MLLDATTAIVFMLPYFAFDMEYAVEFVKIAVFFMLFLYLNIGIPISHSSSSALQN